jgi:hypothetical protein
VAGGFGTAWPILFQSYFYATNTAGTKGFQIGRITKGWDTVLTVVPAGELQDRFTRFKNTGFIVNIGYGGSDIGHSSNLILLLNSKVFNALIGFRHFDFSTIFCH